MLKEGERLGRYEICRLLGKGGWGEVYEAFDPELERRVAVKLIPSEQAVDPEVRERFQREARAVAGLDHPNIVTLHSVEEDQGRRFITMQLVRGRTLSELIPEGGLELDDFFKLAVPLVDAVAAAHAKGVTHRDIKPGNVMVTDEGQVKVLDFGLAKLVPSDDAATLAAGSQTATGTVLGTLNYMSPEQLRGEIVDHRSDIFSLGIVLYEMATGRVPFRGTSSLEVAASILRDRPSTISEVRGGLPRHLDRILKICLSDDPGKRFQSAVDLRNQLTHLREELGADETQVWAAAPKVRSWRPRRPFVAGLALVALLAATGGWLITRSGSEQAAPPREAPTTAQVAESDSYRRIVVLPFEDLGPPSVDYFSTGLTEEISSRLTAVDGLGVISRISADQYAGTTKTARQIGDELGVAYILQGRVLWAASGGASRVKIAPKLIRVADDTEIWGEPYERSIDDIFDLQSEIAGSVARQLGSRLVGRPGGAGEERPTASIEAYQAYLRGLHYARRPVYTRENFANAIAGLREAVEADPEFAAAWAQLARSHALVYQVRLDLSEERKTLARQAMERAVELAPDDPEVRLAVGYYHYEIEQAYDRALAEFDFAESRLPSSHEVHEAKGYVLRRAGRWEEARDRLRKAFELNPLDSAMAAEVAETHVVLREYAEALRLYEQSIALDPDQVWAYVAKAWAHWLHNGDLAGARATLERMPETEESMAVWAWFWQEIYEGSPQRALARLPEDRTVWIESSEWTQPAALLAAQAHELAGDREAGRRAYEAAAAQLRSSLESLPSDARRQSALGLAYAGLGRQEDALEHSRRAVELLPVSRDAFSGNTFVLDLAMVYARTGRAAQSLELLEELLSRPGAVSAAWLQLDPRWRPLARESGFRELTGS